MEHIYEWLWTNRELVGWIAALTALFAAVFGLFHRLRTATLRTIQAFVSFRRPRRPRHYKEYQISPNRLTTARSIEPNIYLAGFNGHLYKFHEQTSRIPYDELCSTSIIRSLSPSIHNRYIIIGDDAGDLKTFDTQRKEITLSGTSGSSVFSIRAATNNKTLITAHRDGEVRRWNINNAGQSLRCELVRIEHSHHGAAFSIWSNPRCSEIISAGADGALIFTDQQSPQPITLPISDAAIFSLDSSRNMWVAGDASGKIHYGQRPHLVKKMKDDFQIESKYQEFIAHEDNVRALQLSAQGKYLITGSKDGTVKLWNLQSSLCWILSTANEYVYDLAFYNEQRQAFSVDGRGSLRLYSFGENIDQMSADSVDSRFRVR